MPREEEGLFLLALLSQGKNIPEMLQGKGGKAEKDLGFLGVSFFGRIPPSGDKPMGC